MIKTALSIIQSMCYRENTPAPATIASGLTTDRLQLLNLLYATCEDLRQSRAFPVAKRLYEFSTTSGTSKYKLPKDYYGALLGTAWNQSENNVLVGPVSDAEFTYRLYGQATSSLNYIYRITSWDSNPNTEGGQIELTPTPSSTQTLSIEYITRHFILPANWAPSTAYSLTDEVNVNGNIYVCSSAGTSSADDPPSGTSTGITDGTAEWDYDNEPYEAVVNDTDLVLYDADLVKLGLRAKWLEAHGGDYVGPAQEFKTKIDQAASRMKGSRVGDMGAESFGPLYHVPDRNWSF